MRQQSGERWDEMEDMDDDKDDEGADSEGADGEEDHSEEDVAEGELRCPESGRQLLST